MSARNAWLNARRRLGEWGRAAVHSRAVLLHISAIICGWSLITWGVASVVSVWQVWPISYGILLLCIAGIGHLRTVFTVGIYGLSSRRG